MVEACAKSQTEYISKCMSLTVGVSGKIRILNKVLLGTSLFAKLWILFSGNWNDLGIWLDELKWNDGV